MRVWFGVALTVLLTMVVIAWAVSPAPLEKFEQLADRYQGIALSAGGTLVRPVSAQQTEVGAIATWSVSSDDSLTDYADRLEQALGGQFRRVVGDGDVIKFRRTYEAEIHQIEVQKHADEDVLQVTLTVEPW